MPSPALDDDLGLAQRVEDLAVEKLVAQTCIEALDEAILPRTARRDVGGFCADRAGETARIGRVSKCGDAMMRVALYEAAFVALTRSQGRWNPLKAWGMDHRQAARNPKGDRRCRPQAGNHLHRMWRDETDFRWTAAKV